MGSDLRLLIGFQCLGISNPLAVWVASSHSTAR